VSGTVGWNGPKMNRDVTSLNSGAYMQLQKKTEGKVTSRGNKQWAAWVRCDFPKSEWLHSTSIRREKTARRTTHGKGRKRFTAMRREKNMAR